MAAVLTREELERLYLEELLTETQIAQRYALSQMQVNRLRKTYGIPTLQKSDRIKLPPLSQTQKSLLLGSMLGDGRIFSTGGNTAALSEFHSLDQEAYLQWKADLWGPWVCSLRESKSVKNGKEFFGKILRTHASRELFPYWKSFYPEGRGDKVFYAIELAEFDALALAIWFLDDGSKSPNGYIRFHVTPDLQSQEVQLALLRRFGLDPTLYKEGRSSSIWLTERASLTKFLDLVGEHIPSSMHYKLELVPRVRGEAPRDLLTQERLVRWGQDGRSVEWVSKATGISDRGVRQALEKHSLSLESKGPSLSWEAAKAVLEVPGVSEDRAVEILLDLDLPAPPSEDAILRDFHNLKARTLTQIQDGLITGGGRVGLAVCEALFPYRYEASRNNAPSLERAWFNEDYLRKAVAFQRKVGDPVLPRNVFRALKALVRNPSNFRPAVAKKLAETFSPKEGLILDPCSGYGGRAVGVLAAGRRYVGADPHPKAGLAFSRLHELLGGSVEFFNAPFEEVDLPQDLQADLVMTSPPYFSVERYSNDARQSWVRYPTWDLWVERFLKVFIAKSFNALKPGGRFVLNVADITDGRPYPLVQVSTDIAKSVGFVHEDTLDMVLGVFGGRFRSEPVLIFLKEGGQCLVPYVPVLKGPARKDVYNTRIQGLTEETLRDLYERQLLPDVEIAKRLSVSDVLVSQQRKRFGIPTMTSRQRKDLKQGG